jgi:acetyl esterase/lipase
MYCCHLFHLQYTLYPEGLVPQLVDEVSAAFDWAMEHVQQYGGDTQQVGCGG